MSQEAMRRERLDTLRSTPMFAGLRPESLDRLAAASKFVVVSRGHFLFYQNDPAETLYILQSGEMAIVLSSLDGREMIIDEVHPGDCFGEVSLLTSGERTAGARAREKCRVLEITARSFLAVLDGEPALARQMLDIATQRLFKSQRRESALAFLGAPARVARVLLEMDEADKRGPDKGFITLSQEELAQRTGLARQTVSSSLGNWRQKDWLLTGRGRIMLLNRAALRRVAEESLL
jgi:CRP-like cAMP-binding protein